MKFNTPTFEETSGREWLVTNGIGGYASGTVSGANTRRYHGLLVASASPPTDRSVLVSKIEERIGTGGAWFALSANRYPDDIVHPRGFELLTRFERSPLPTWTYKAGEHQLEKTVVMPHGANTVVVAYKNTGKQALDLSLTPFLVDRDYHSLFKVAGEFDYYLEEDSGQLKIHSRHGSEPLYWYFSGGRFTAEKHWIEKLTYVREEYRGLDFREDARTIGRVLKTLAPGETYHVVFSADASQVGTRPEKVAAAELKRQKTVVAGHQDEFLQDLLLAGDQCIVRRSSTDSYTILAGYHWFTDWGRDTMIAMRGLCIATGRREVSASILKTFLQYLDRGMLPNRFPDDTSKEVVYNTVDATLWLFVAAYEHYRAFDDLELIKTYFGDFEEIIRQHLDGTRYNIHTTGEGFLFAGEEGVQLTWMDALVDGFVVTPRRGCPVEIQALWYNALQIYLFFAGELGKGKSAKLTGSVRSTSEKIRNNFRKYFMNETGYLNDVVVPGETADDAIRPNQIYVLSLPFQLLGKADGKKVFRTVREHLFTPLGLRSLSPEHSDFVPVYGGDTWARDTAYHQGTVWTFLIGEYYAAQRRLFGNTAQVNKEIEELLQPLHQHFYQEDCLHGVSEIFDGKAPAAGRGTVNQAWSVAAIIQTLLAR